MRLPPRLTIVLVVCLIAIALPAAPVQADGASISLSPSSGVPGEEIKVRGYNFTAEKWVDIYYDETWIDDIQTDDDGDFPWVTFTVPESYKGDHTVRVEDTQGKIASTDFNVKPGLIISPQEGSVGTTVIVEGVGFAEDEENIQLIYYSSGSSEVIEDDIPADEDGSWQYGFQIPPSSQGSHRIDAEGDDSRLHEVRDATFTVIAGISLSTLSGSVGDTITVTGNGFVANERDIKILFDGEEMDTGPDIIRADDSGHWNGTFEVPEMPADEYSVTAEGEFTDEENITALSFEIGPGLVLSPNQGHVGTNLTVTGGGFPASKNVVIKYDGSQQATARSNTQGSFSGVTFPVPESQYGARQVTAEVDGEVEATRTFTMESVPPPVPQLISPPDGSRVGLIGSVTPMFQWSEVSDPSGVRYNLQIATSANVTGTGNFTDALVTVSNWGAANYTLNAAQALSYGTYYWIVQAVDRAENAGDWTAAGSFRVGLLPLWASIVILVAIVALIGILLYFFVIRRRIYYY